MLLGALVLASVFSLSSTSANLPPFEGGYSTGPSDSYDVAYFCTDRVPYDGDEPCEDDARWIVRAADRDIYRRGG